MPVLLLAQNWPEPLQTDDGQVRCVNDMVRVFELKLEVPSLSIFMNLFLTLSFSS